MDDRLTMAMYWEMTDRSIDEHRAEREPLLEGRADVLRSSYWRNVGEAVHEAVPQRSHLALYEVAVSFAPPTPLDGDLSYHYIQARPSQGRLGTEPANALWTVMVDPKGDSQAYRDWADFVHLPAILDAQLPGFRQVTPYRHAAADAGAVPEYLNFWDLATDDPLASVAGLGPAMVERFGQDTPEFAAWLAPADGYVVMSRTVWVRA